MPRAVRGVECTGQPVDCAFAPSRPKPPSPIDGALAKVGTVRVEIAGLLDIGGKHTTGNLVRQEEDRLGATRKPAWRCTPREESLVFAG
jgi:hypothetical protein